MPGDKGLTIGVVIPAYNASATIRATLESVLQQTVQPDEILVMDDGSTDDTSAVASSFGPKVTVLRQTNKGLSGARNAAIANAHCSFIAFLDSDDLWHPRYLETQMKAASLYPQAVAFFASHLTFFDGEAVEWKDVPASMEPAIELIQPEVFLPRYASVPGPFLPSFCAVPRQTLDRFGEEPFRLRVAEDVYFVNRLAFIGPVAFCSAPVGAYRLRQGSLSSNRVSLNEGEVRAFELLEEHKQGLSKELTAAFDTAFAIKRRLYAKTLMGVGRKAEARQQLVRSLRHSLHPRSLVKSAGLLCATHAPARLQPRWGAAVRSSGNGPRPA